MHKFRYVRSKKLLEACREITCQLCGAQDGTVVAAHSNQAKHGKGRGIKASDEFVAALCFRCHHEIDQGASMRKEARQDAWDLAHEKTKARLAHLWPQT
jgi:hypothetical protein